MQVGEHIGISLHFSRGRPSLLGWRVIMLSVQGMHLNGVRGGLDFLQQVGWSGGP